MYEKYGVHSVLLGYSFYSDSEEFPLGEKKSHKSRRDNRLLRKKLATKVCVGD